jgi:outer membrane protein TolC
VAGLDFNETVQQQQGYNNTVFDQQFTPSLTLNYPLYHSGAYMATARRGKEGIKQAQLQNLMDRRDLQAQIEALYFDLMLKEKRFVIAQEDYDAFERNLKATVTSTTSELSMEDQRLQKEQKKLDLDRMHNDILSTEKGLKKAAGIHREMDLKFTFTGFPSSLQIPAQWLPESLLATPISRTYESQAREQSDIAVESKAENKPLLDLVSGFYQNQVEEINSHAVNQQNYFVGLQLRWTLFNGWRGQALTAAAYSRERKLQALSQQELQNSRDALNEDLLALKNQAIAYDIALSRKKIAATQYEAQTALQKQGQTSQEAFEAAKRNYDSMEIDALQSLADFLKLYAKIQRNMEMAQNP